VPFSPLEGISAWRQYTINTFFAGSPSENRQKERFLGFLLP
jgi:hypothetical protein